MKKQRESLKLACEMLGVSRSGFYSKKGSKKSLPSLNLVLTERIKELRLIHPFWGYRRMTACLKYREGYAVNHKRIQKLMQENGLTVETKKLKALRTSSRPKPRATRPN
jgi:hypothetical protein